VLGDQTLPGKSALTEHPPRMKVVGRHFRSGQPVELRLADRIVEVSAPAGGSTLATDLPWIAPGLVDLQINGYRGHEFGSPQTTVEAVVQIVEQLPAFGVTRFLPTVTTASRETLLHALSVLARAVATVPRVASSVAGVHLEGPYISAADGPRGAHPARHCRPPDWSEFAELQSAAGGLIRLVTLSAEFAEAPQFISRLRDAGITVALGHMNANAAQIRAAVDAGATLSTHLGNGADPILPRHPNYIWDQLAEDRLTATLIADGHHLPPAVVKSFVRAKTPERIVLVSDLSGMAGLPAGEYSTDFCRIEILADGRIVVAGQRQMLAGAARPIAAGIANAMRFAGVDLAAAVDMATSAPLRVIGLPSVELTVGQPADVVLLRLQRDREGLPCEVTIERTIAGGQVVFERPGAA
jgi:N-acetylglucosamine-6-phosphate deacetylase